MRVNDRKLSDHFWLSEFRCDCGCGEERVSLRFLAKLEAMRKKAGELVGRPDGLPLKVISGARCRNHNKAVGGEDGSLHVPENGDEDGCQAVDIACSGSYMRFIMIKAAMLVDMGGIGIRNGSIHVDDRPVDVHCRAWLYPTK